jgi:hypothetical protein
MKKFLKLLNPWEKKGFLESEAAGRFVEEQQRRAREQFPAMVDHSNLHYWRPGDAISRQGTRFLIALGAGFSLHDLRFADVLNEALSNPLSRPIRVDVFDIEDLSNWEDLHHYFPGTTRTRVTPVVGVWEDGTYQTTLYGAAGMDRVLSELQIPMNAKDVVSNLCPPDPKLMED